MATNSYYTEPDAATAPPPAPATAITFVEINDIRSATEFKTCSFSRYKRSAVAKELTGCISKGRVESAVHWCAELVCAGHFADIWECVVTAIGRYVGNAKLAIYAETRLAAFRDIYAQGLYVRELDIRNRADVRALFAEVVCVLALAPKRPVVQPIKLDKDEGFDVVMMQERLVAPDTGFGETLFLKEDPEELFVAVNELAFALSPQAGGSPETLATAWYWTEWIIEFAAMCVRRKMRCRCRRREFAPVEPARQMDTIWLVWDIIRRRAEMQSRLAVAAVDAAMALFAINYTPAAAKRRRYIIYFAAGLAVDCTGSSSIVADKDKPVLHSVLSQLDELYGDIKKNEVGANTEYLFAALNEAQTAMDQSVKRMQIVNSMDLPAFFDDRPR
jgi:hypothetical protein